MRVKILGRYWDLDLFWRSKVHDGDCDTPAKRGKKIKIDRTLRGRERLETLIHEFMHAADWHKDEDEWVAPVAHDIARILWRLGYRSIDDLPPK